MPLPALLLFGGGTKADWTAPRCCVARSFDRVGAAEEDDVWAIDSREQDERPDEWSPLPFPTARHLAETCLMGDKTVAR